MTTIHADASAEHLALDPTSELWGEHRSRYRFAAVQVIGKRVLDAACGSGFGSKMLRAAGARQVTGVDLSPDALRESRAASTDAGVAHVRADLSTLPFASGSFDVVVSMETIEHVAEPRRVLAEFARCLSRGGTLILSTPNRLFRPGVNGRPANPYHVREYAPDELRRLLSEWFEIRLFGQRVESSYAAVPYLLGADQRGLRTRRATQLIPWKVANRLPPRARDGLSWTLFKQAFYPTEFDYSFSPDAVDSTHDLVAVGVLRR